MDDISYDDYSDLEIALDNLTEKSNKTTTPGSFYYQNKIESPISIKLKDDQDTFIAFPCVPSQLLEIIDKHAKRAPFVGLGIREEEKVEANLYKLLIYDQGGFFLPHTDTEKEDRMFGTLTLVLPSKHKGGNLLISHGKETVTLNLENNQSANEINYSAFYADCKHEVKPVESGYRVCLIYNLIKSGKRVLSASALEDRNSKNEEELEQMIKVEYEIRKLLDSGNPSKLVYVLDHEYTNAQRTFKDLKGKDQIVGSCLQQISKRFNSGITVFLASLKIEEQVYGDFDYYDRFEVTGDSEINKKTLSNLVDHDDIRTDIDGVDFEFGEVIPTGSLDGLKPYKSENSGPTGNEGASEERTYKQSCIVIYLTEDLPHLLPSSSYDWTFEFLFEKFVNFDKKSEKKNEEQIRKIRKIIKSEDPENYDDTDDSDEEESDEDEEESDDSDKDTGTDNLNTANFIIKYLKRFKPNEPLPDVIQDKLDEYIPSFIDYIESQRKLRFLMLYPLEFIKELKSSLESKLFSNDEIYHIISRFKFKEPNIKASLDLLFNILVPLNKEYPNQITNEMIEKFIQNFEHEIIPTFKEVQIDIPQIFYHPFFNNRYVDKFNILNFNPFKEYWGELNKLSSTFTTNIGSQLLHAYRVYSKVPKFEYYDRLIELFEAVPLGDGETSNIYEKEIKECQDARLNLMTQGTTVRGASPNVLLSNWFNTLNFKPIEKCSEIQYNFSNFIIENYNFSNKFELLELFYQKLSSTSPESIPNSFNFKAYLNLWKSTLNQSNLLNDKRFNNPESITISNYSIRNKRVVECAKRGTTCLCTQLNEFLLNPIVNKITLRTLKKEREHLQAQYSSIKDVVSFNYIGNSPIQIQVTKITSNNNYTNLQDWILQISYFSKISSLLTNYRNQFDSSTLQIISKISKLIKIGNDLINSLLYPSFRSNSISSGPILLD